MKAKSYFIVVLTVINSFMSLAAVAKTMRPKPLQHKDTTPLCGGACKRRDESKEFYSIDDKFVIDTEATAE